MTKYEQEREFTRVTTRFRVRVESGERAIESGHTRDLSMKGVFVVSDTVLETGCECDLTIRFDDSDNAMGIHARGSVVRVEESPRGFALQFSALNLDGYEHLRQMVMLNARDTGKVVRELGDHLGLKRR